MSAQDLFVAAARKCLSGRRKSLSVPPSLDLAAQVLAVDSGVKPALLYDTNGATAEQVQRYLNALQSAQLVSPSLLTLDVCGHALIVNPLAVMSNLEELLRGGSVAVIDVCHSLEKPAITDPLRGELKIMAQDLLVSLREYPQAEKPLNVSDKCEKWNLCTLFGLLLGYPVTYWFDQNNSSENCLAMTPLMVTTASATWSAGRRCCLYSFSIPAVLHKDTESNMEQWNLRLQEKFQHQTVLKDLNVCQSMVTLPAVNL
ncbi:UPF0739 protein C1orf74 homolog [Genypterus blacodes]|uniref:UPF0739 protein C1orf74 homolog n=1 Tax=Genypterus blacodes TaxID=154954 RepID=UPI003F75B891